MGAFCPITGMVRNSNSNISLSCLSILFYFLFLSIAFYYILFYCIVFYSIPFLPSFLSKKKDTTHSLTTQSGNAPNPFPAAGLKKGEKEKLFILKEKGKEIKKEHSTHSLAIPLGMCPTLVVCRRLGRFFGFQIHEGDGSFFGSCMLRLKRYVGLYPRQRTSSGPIVSI